MPLDQKEGSYAFWGRSSSSNAASRRNGAQNDKLGVAASVASKASSALCARQDNSSNDDTKSVPMQIAEKSKEAFLTKHRTSDKKNVVHSRESRIEAKSNIIKEAPLLESGSIHSSYVEVDMDEVRVDPPEQSEVVMSKAKSLELSLALDGLEISWEELSIKERIGAGKQACFLGSANFWFDLALNKSCGCANLFWQVPLVLYIGLIGMDL